MTLVAVTKTYPAGDVELLSGLGVTDVGENRDQEAAAKAAEVTATGATLRWHYVGRLQRNKCRSVVRYADVVQSVDSVRLAGALDEASRAYRDRRWTCWSRSASTVTRTGAERSADGADADRDLWRVADAVAGTAGSGSPG